MASSEIARRLAFAEAAARDAGALALDYFRNRDRLGTKMKGFQDFLTIADGEVEAMLRRRVAEAFPDDGFLGEEGGGTAADRLWVVDPIDGTANFARGEPYWCVSIGFLEKGKPVIGVVFVPVLGELYAAVAGEGARCNGTPIRVAATTDVKVASVEIGWSPRRPTKAYIKLIEEVMALGATSKRSASGALGICWTACGRVDGYLELHINAWDVAAGLVIAREARATTNDFFAGAGLAEGNPILCTTPAIAGAMAGLMGLDPRSLLNPH